MTIEVPPSPTEATTVVKDNKVQDIPVTTAVIEKKDDEPILSTQVEPTGEENSPLPSTSTEDKPKRKGLFNNPFANKVKKDSEEVVTTLNDTAETSENKISKGFGNFLSKVKKQTASSNNIKELSDPVPATTATTREVVEGEQAVDTEDAHENATTEATHDNNNKRQSILSKIFGGNNGTNKKKEEETTTATEQQKETDHTEANHTHAPVTTDQQHSTETTEETIASSPPLSRRVTGFFAKKLPKLDKKQKSSTITDKVETTTSPTEESHSRSIENKHTTTEDTTEPVVATKQEETPVVNKITETTPVDTATITTNNNATTA